MSLRLGALSPLREIFDGLDYGMDEQQLTPPVAIGRDAPVGYLGRDVAELSTPEVGRSSRCVTLCACAWSLSLRR